METNHHCEGRGRIHRSCIRLTKIRHCEMIGSVAERSTHLAMSREGDATFITKRTLGQGVTMLIVVLDINCEYGIQLS